MSKTHEVFNQPPPLQGYNVFRCDRAVTEAVEREGAAWAVSELEALGEKAGSTEAIRWGFEANEFPPRLRTHDRYGHRVDEVEFHPSYHKLMGVAVEHGLHARPWREERPGAHVARAAKFYVWSQVDAGHGCPISMTYSVIPALRHAPELSSVWEPVIASDHYDPVLAPIEEKRGATVGMAMTEKQGGSDVRANTTLAEPDDVAYRITGHKWFCSAPMSDGFLLLAKIGVENPPSCFLVPRVLPDGTRNVFQIQRLKDKLGNRSNASSEIELENTVGFLVGEPHAGIRTILEMVNHTRLDCVTGSAATLRQALTQALHHAQYRVAFGRRLRDQPLMKNVLADLAVESEAATTMAMRLARAYDARDDAREADFRRIATAVGKYWVNKRLPMAVGEALECLGGAGYVEESMMPRLFRESPLNGIWEGSGNVICLDVLRAIRQPGALDALLDECELARGEDAHFDRFLADLHGEISHLADHKESSESGKMTYVLKPDQAELRARRTTERLALALQGSLLLRHAPRPVAHAFVEGRIRNPGLAFGTLPQGVNYDAILDRATVDFEPNRSFGVGR